VVSKVAGRYKFRMRTLTTLASCLLLLACQGTHSAKDVWVLTPDTHSFARPSEVRSTHLELNLNLDFEAKVATGSVTHELERTDPTAAFVVDTSELSILAVTDQDGNKLTYQLAAEATPFQGRPLTIELGPQTRKVKIGYQTSPAAEAMQWLSPEQTSGKQKPFLFTQGQAILTRSWIPLQDTPAVRVTWDARITSPEGLTTVMSADWRKHKGNQTNFRMSRPVPSYLFAIG